MNQTRAGYRRQPQTAVLAVLDGYEEYLTGPQGEKPAAAGERNTMTLPADDGPAQQAQLLLHVLHRRLHSL